VYLADAGNHTLRRVAPDGTATTLAGSAGNSGSADGKGGQARFSWPADVALDREGNLYVADRGNHAIRKVTPAGAVTTLAGAAGKSGRANGAGSAARFNNPSGVAIDAVGNVYVADTGNQTIRKIMPGGEVTTLAGCAGMRGGTDGIGYLARFNGPSAVVVDAAGNVYVADRDNHMIRRVSPDGTVTTLGGQPNRMSAADGIGGAARFAQPSGIALDDAGVLYVADACNNRIAIGVPYVAQRTSWSPAHGKNCAVQEPVVSEETKTAPYVWETFAGKPGNAGTDDGQGQSARLKGPQGIAFGAQGKLCVVDGSERAIRVIAPDGTVVTRTLPDCRWTAPIGIAAANDGTCYVTDAAHVLWKVMPAGEVLKVAGVARQRGTSNGVGENARFNFIPGIAADHAENLYLADGGNRMIRKVSPEGDVSTWAGAAGVCGSADGAGAAARFTFPTAVTSDRRGRLLVADDTRLRAVSPDGAVTTLAQGSTFGRIDGLAVDADGNVYAADRGRHAIWKVSPNGAVTKLGGSELAMGGSGWLVTGLAVDRQGRVYVSDSVRNCILRGTPKNGR